MRYMRTQHKTMALLNILIFFCETLQEYNSCKIKYYGYKPKLG